MKPQLRAYQGKRESHTETQTQKHTQIPTATHTTPTHRPVYTHTHNIHTQRERERGREFQRKIETQRYRGRERCVVPGPIKPATYELVSRIGLLVGFLPHSSSQLMKSE